MKASDQYLKIVEWSEEDQCYIGYSPGFIGPCCHGDDEAEVYRELCKIVEEWIDIHRQDNTPLPRPLPQKSFSGKFVIRVGQELHKALVIKAAISGQSLNHFCTALLKQSLATKN